MGIYDIPRISSDPLSSTFTSNIAKSGNLTVKSNFTFSFSQLGLNKIKKVKLALNLLESIVLNSCGFTLLRILKFRARDKF